MNKPERPANSYSLVWAGNDPDLPYSAAPEHAGRSVLTGTHLELDAAWRYVVESASPIDHLLTIFCQPHGCGVRKTGAGVADVFLTPYGLLYYAPLVRGPDYWTSRRVAVGHDPIPPQWQPSALVRVRDLLDRDDLGHVPLKWQCPKLGDGPAFVRAAILAEVQKAKSSQARRVAVGTLLAVS